MKIILSLFILFPTFLLAQCTVASIDTFACSSGDMLMLEAVTNSAFDTENYTISNIPYSPIVGLKTQPLVIGDDQTLGPFPIGFSFNFFNSQYDEFYICSNGFVSFMPAGASYNNVSLPDGGAPHAAIFAAWEDWNPSWGQGEIRYETLGIVPNRYLVIEYDSVNSYNCGGGAQAGVWQIILRENSNEIELQIGEKPQCNTLESVQGIQNETGALAFTVSGRNDTTWTASNEGILFSPNMVPDINWYDPSGSLLTTGISGQLFPDETGVYVVELINSAGCYYTDSFHIQVSYQAPTIDQNGAVLLCNEPGFDYQWHLDGSPISGAVSQFLIPQQNGMYQVSVTDFHDCEVFSDSLMINSLNIQENHFSLNVYPNPSSTSQLNIEVEEELKLSILNIEGRVVSSMNLRTGNQLFDTRLKQGVYFLRFESKDAYVIKRWVFL